MQCLQPPFCTGFQNNPQFSPVFTQQYPDVIGEGDVMSYVLPDGSVQYYFVPASRRERWIPHCTNSYYMPSSLPSWPNNKEAWFVRSILNPYPTVGSNQLSNYYIDACSRSNINLPSYGFIQKFHNDGCTSTTDLHYFFPSLSRDWAKGCAGIQVEIPNGERTIFHCGTVCNRPCYCNQKIEIPKTEPNLIETPMCVDETKSTHSCREDTRKKEKHCCKRKNHSCVCTSRSRVNTADKMITTYADQSISCTNIKETNCQACKCRTDIKPELWYPRKRKHKRNYARCSSNTECDSACSLDSARSDTEQCCHK